MTIVNLGAFMSATPVTPVTPVTPIRWGILGTGHIAKKFATGLSSDAGSRLVAVGSRTAAAAAAFASEYPCTAHGSYAALCADTQVDAIYIASPHTNHREHALLAISQGKSLLIEKPFCVNAREAGEVIAAARAAGVFCMEAMWTRCLPAMRQVAAWLAEQAIGEVRLLTADFGFRANWNPQSRLLDPHLAGGALLDVGVYTVAMAWLAMGSTPTTIKASSVLGTTGVDEVTAVTLGWANGALANLTCAVRLNTKHDAIIYGTEGRIEVPDFWHGTKVHLHRDGQPSVSLELPFLGNGYTHEIMEVGRCLRAGLKESPLVPHAESLAIMRCLDECRSQIGLVYPGERISAQA